MKHTWLLRSAVLSAFALAGSSCGSATGTDEVTPVASVVVTPSSSDLGIGKTLPLQAKLQDAGGHLVPDVPIVWSSGNPDIATVSNLGIVTAKALGTVEIAASSQGRSGIATILVRAAPVSSVVVQPDHAETSVGGSTDLKALTYDPDGTLLTGRALVWSSSNEGVATVDNAGHVTGVAPGTATIAATSEGKSATSLVTVSRQPVASVTVAPSPASVQVGQTTQLVVVVKDPNGATLGDRSVAWTSSNEDIATVSQAGVVTGRVAGTAVITATSEGVGGQTTLTVSAIPVASVVVTPPTLNLMTGGSFQLTATAKDAAGNALAGRGMSWTSSNMNVATVNGSGLVVAVAPGTATITATSEGKSDISSVTVTTVPVASVAVSPSASTVLPGQSTQLTATPRDAGGNPLAGRAVSWTSSNTGIATVSPTGLVTGATPGTATITATSEGQSGTATITVSPTPVASVTVAPSSATLTTGQSTSATATPRDAAGNTLDRTVAWTSSDPGIATISAQPGANTATITAVGAGTATITATSEGKSGTVTVSVSTPPPAPVATVAVSPTTAAVNVGQSTTLTATTRDASNNPLTGRAVAWTSSNTAVATVSSGVVTGVAPGTVTITATSEGKSGTASITVSTPPPAPVATVTVAPTTATVNVGQSTTLTATPRDAANTALTGRTITWSSSNAGIATVSPTGLVTGVAAGTATITATSEGKNGTASVTVSTPPPAPVATVTVAPTTATVRVGQTTPLTATLRDGANKALTGRVVTWTSSNANVAKVDGTGVVTGVAAGSATITATSEGKTGTATVTVQPAAVSHVEVVPSSITIGTREGTADLTARMLDDAGNDLTGRAVEWQTSDAGVVTVNPAGHIKGIRTGSATITAVSEGRSGTARVTVTS